jgi:tripartite-type tricarboxylate transporter receptor subunit TctC
MLFPASVRTKVLPAIALLLSLASAQPALSQAYPSRALRLIVPFPAGGTTDIVARFEADALSAQMGQAVVVDNRGGASGLIGADTIIKSAPDGYTLGLLVSPTLISGIFNARDWSPDNDMTPIGLNYRQGILLAINPNQPLLKDVKSGADMVRVIKANPGKVYFGTIGVGTTGHLLGELMKTSNGLQWEHLPYKGAAQLTQDVVAGEQPIVLMGASADDPTRYPGRVLLIATSGATRQAGVTPLAETGFPGMDATTWGGFIGPGHIPAPVLTKLVSAYKAAFERPDTHEKADKVLTQEYLPPEELGKLIKSTLATWTKVIKDNNIKP